MALATPPPPLMAKVMKNVHIFCMPSLNALVLPKKKLSSVHPENTVKPTAGVIKIAPIFVVLLFWKYIFSRHYFPLQMLLVTFWWWSKVANGKSVWFRGNTIECVGPIWFQLLPGRALFCVSRRALPYTDDHDKDNVAGIHFNFIFCHHQGDDILSAQNRTYIWKYFKQK